VQHPPGRPAHCGNLLGGMVAGMAGGMVRRGAASNAVQLRMFPRSYHNVFSKRNTDPSRMTASLIRIVLDRDRYGEHREDRSGCSQRFARVTLTPKGPHTGDRLTGDWLPLPQLHLVGEIRRRPDTLAAFEPQPRSSGITPRVD
jgi:hypothetical protein